MKNDRGKLDDKTEFSEREKIPWRGLHRQGIVIVLFCANRGLASQCLHNFFHAFHETGEDGDVTFDISAALG